MTYVFGGTLNLAQSQSPFSSISLFQSVLRSSFHELFATGLRNLSFSELSMSKVNASGVILKY